MNVCGAAEAPKEQTGKWMASKSSLTNVSRKNETAVQEVGEASKVEIC